MVIHDPHLRPLPHKAFKKAGPALRFSEHLEGVCQGPGGHRLERADSRYRSGPCAAWLKVKLSAPLKITGTARIRGVPR
jgi:hypothetical protein